MVDFGALKTAINGLKTWTEERLRKKADSTDIPTIPTKVSTFENDSGYLTEHQDLSEYATSSQINPRIDEVESIANNAQTAADAAQTTADSKSEYGMANINLPKAQKWNSPIYADGKFVVFPYTDSSIAAYSTDGITWTETTLPKEQNWSSPIYADGKFVTVPLLTNSSIAAYSTDGISWTETTLPKAQAWSSPIYADGKFVTVPNYSASSSIAAYSTDGISWTETTLPVSQKWSSPIYADGKFVVFPSKLTSLSIAAYSTDGISWTETTLPKAQAWNSPIYADGKFVTVPNYSASSSIAAYSTDGISWTETTLPVSQKWSSPIYADGKFVTVPLYTYSSIAAYSTDGITWTETTLPVTHRLSSCIYADGKFVVFPYTDSSIAAYSTDGISWTETTLPVSQKWSSPIYADGKFVTVPNSASSIAAYSTDGITWTETTLPKAQEWSSPIYADGKFVTVSFYTRSSIAAYSTDGITWCDSYACCISQNGEDITEKVKELLLADTAAKSDIPTNVSAFTNDAGYITAEEVPEGFSGSWNDLSDRPFYESKSHVFAYFTLVCDQSDMSVLEYSHDGELPVIEIGTTYQVTCMPKNSADTIFTEAVVYDDSGARCIDLTDGSILKHTDDNVYRWYRPGDYGRYNPFPINEYTILIMTLDTVFTIDERFLPATVPAISSATVGQTIIVKSVDENGKPTEWEAADMASGAGLPEGATAHQQLVTDGDGVTKWEDKLTYSETGYVVPVQPYDSSTSEKRSSVINFTEEPTVIETGAYMYSATIGYYLTDDTQLVTVYFDGIPYIVQHTRNQYWTLGNGSLRDSSTEDTGEPFLLSMSNTGDGYLVLYAKTSGSHTVEIKLYGEYIKGIDIKYMPAQLTDMFTGYEGAGFNAFNVGTFGPVLGNVYAENGENKVAYGFAPSFNAYPNLTVAPTADDFNFILNVLREYGLLMSE